MSELREPVPKELRIVYLAGAQNSGSTLLDTVLGNAPEAFSLGEVGGFHRYASETDCECGEPSAACGPCRAVVSSLSASGDVGAFHCVGRLPLKERRAHWIVVRTRARADYARLSDAVFDAVAAATGSTVLVDSSKNVARAAALVQDSRHDVRVVHLVRDGRGYLRSRQRRAAASGGRYVPAFAMAAWLAKNLLISVLLRRRMAGSRYLMCRYEDLVSDPVNELRRIGEFAGLDTTGLHEAVTSEGLRRRHLFEPKRRADYRTVRLDPARLRAQRLSPAASLAYWACGGFLSRRWGYDLRQSYLARTKTASAS